MISLNSRVVRRLLDFFFIHEDDSFYLNEIVRRIDVDKRNLSKQIKELERSGLFNVEKKGNLKLYSLNKNYPLYNEYKKIISRTTGFQDKLKKILVRIQGIKKAFIFGSYVNDKGDSLSDIDVMIIGNHSIVKLQKEIAKIQKDYDRVINITNMDMNEYLKNKNKTFLKKVLEGDVVELI